jgi:hypothetical protein
LIAAKIDVKDSLEAHDFDIVNAIEAEIRKGLADKKCFIYIEIDEWQADYEKVKEGKQ